MLAEAGPKSPSSRAAKVAELLRRAQEECLPEPGRPTGAQDQALFDTIAEVLEGLIQALPTTPRLRQ